eukprot:COSAG02_NODE_3743_length_6299_cov_27.086452_3_plen_87_part_00
MPCVNYDLNHYAPNGLNVTSIQCVLNTYHLHTHTTAADPSRLERKHGNDGKLNTLSPSLAAVSLPLRSFFRHVFSAAISFLTLPFC